MTDIIDNEGLFVWADPKSRLEIIEEQMKPKLEEIKRKVDENDKRMYPQKLNFIGVLNNYLDTCVRKGDRVRYDDAITINYNILKGFYDAWFDLMAFIREYYPEYFANKQLFSGFCGFSTQVFDYLTTSQDADIIALMTSLIDSMIDSNFAAGQSGTTSNTMTTSRLKAGGNAGYDVKIKNESENGTTNNFMLINNENIEKQLKKLGF